MKKYEELKHNRNSLEYEDWFLKYNPVTKYGVKTKDKETKSSVELGKIPKEYQNREKRNTTKRFQKRVRRTQRKLNKKGEFLNIF